MKRISGHKRINMVGRKEWIDALRGLAMIFVICVHLVSKKVYGWEVYNVVTGPIMIPMFFAVTGYVFNDKNGEQKEFYKKLFFKIIIPWLFLSLVWIKLLMAPFKGTVLYFFEGMWDLISGKTIWYMPCCIVAEIIQFYIRKASKKISNVCGLSILCAGIGIIMAYFDVCNFAMINRAFVAQIFMTIGYLFKHYIEHMKLSSLVIVFGALAYVLMIVITIIIWPGQYIDVHLNQYFDLCFSFVMIYVGCLELFLLFSKLKKVPVFLSFIGRNSLFYYMTHAYVLYLVSVVINMFNPEYKITWIGAIIQTCIVCISCGIGAMIVNRFFPEIVGKNRGSECEKCR